MKKKILILVLAVLFTAGCDINYTLDIGNDTFKETTTVKGNPDNEDQSFDLSTEVLYNEYINKPIPTFNDVIMEAESNEKLDGITYYNTEDISDETYLGGRFEGGFTLENITNSTFINYAYADFEITEDDNQIRLSTGPRFKLFEQYPNLDKVTINIKTKQKVIENNSDEFKDNTYTWVINKENYGNKPIKITIQKNFNLENVVKDIKVNDASKDLFIIYGGLALLVALVILLITIKLKKNNKI